MKRKLVRLCFVLLVVIGAPTAVYGALSWVVLVSSRSSFQPNQISTIQVWLDPNDPAYSSNTALNDKSGKGNHFAGGVDAFSLVSGGPNGTTVARFQGVSPGSEGGGWVLSSGYNGPMASTADTTPWEIWYLIKRDADTGGDQYHRVFTFQSKVTIGFHTHGSYGPWQMVRQVGDDFKADVTLDLTNYYLYRVVYNGGDLNSASSYKVYQNTSEKTVSSAGDYHSTNDKSSRIGGGEYGATLNAKMGDVCIFTGNLSAFDVNRMNGFYRKKYDLQF